MTQPRPHPVVRLRPGKDGPDARRAPWLYADRLVLDRRTRGIPAGELVEVQDSGRASLGTYAFNPESRIAARFLHDGLPDQVDDGWIAARLAQAAALRERLYDAPFYRLVHAEGDGLPGVIIDRFGEAAVIQPNAAWADARLDGIVAGLKALGVTTVVMNGQGRARSLEGLDDRTEVLTGAVDAPVPVAMNGATYMADLLGGQKTGLFFDQRPNHALTARLARGGTLLDVFSHVGGFSLAALAGGAVRALAVDSSAPALELATRGAQAGGVADRFETRRSDAFAAMEGLFTEGAAFDTVVCDPPAFAPSKQALTQGLRAYEKVARLGARLVAPGGYLVLCSCSHAAELPKFRNACLRGITRAGRRAQIIATGGAGPDHPLHPELAETGYLKALFFRLVE